VLSSDARLVILELLVEAHRPRVGRLWARLKGWRAPTTRFGMAAASFMRVVCLAATLDRLKQ
jgi:hypothetical protein